MSQEVKIPASDLFKMKRNIERIALAAETNDMINEKEAALLLSVSVKRLQNLVAEGKMEGFYTRGFAGKRFYKKSLLIGLYK